MPGWLVAKAKVAGSNPVFRSNQAWNQVLTLSPGLSFCSPLQGEGPRFEPASQVTKLELFLPRRSQCRALTPLAGSVLGFRGGAPAFRRPWRRRTRRAPRRRARARPGACL